MKFAGSEGTETGIIPFVPECGCRRVTGRRRVIPEFNVWHIHDNACIMDVPCMECPECGYKIYSNATRLLLDRSYQLRVTKGQQIPWSEYAKLISQL